MIVRTIHIDAVDITDHTIGEIFTDADSVVQAAILGRITQIVQRWDSPWAFQCLAIGEQIKKIGMTAEIKDMLQTLVDHL
jgi:hypothetical protein